MTHENESVEQIMERLEKAKEREAETAKVHDDSLTLTNNPHFKPLGQEDGRFILFNYMGGTAFEFTSSQLTSKVMYQAAPKQWWEDAYPKTNKNGDVVGVDWDEAGDDIIQQCLCMPVPRLDMIRGLGAWDDAGRIVINEGSHLVVDGEFTLRHELDTEFYYKKERAPKPTSAIPVTQQDIQDAFNVLGYLEWSAHGSAELLFGWAMLAPICGVLRWRPHVWITANAGKGKSWTLEFIEGLIGGSNRAVIAQGGKTTEPGVRQAMGSRSQPFVMDEAEGSGDKKASANISNIITYFRSGSSQNSARILHGSSSGHSVSYETSSMACMGSISDMLTEDSDKSRFARLTIRSQMSDDDYMKARNIKSDWVHENHHFSKGIMQLHVDNIHNTLANIDTFFEVLKRDMSFNSRDADQYGALIAGCWSGLHLGERCSEEIAKKYLEDIQLKLEDHSTKAFDDVGHEVYSKILGMRINFQGEHSRDESQLYQLVDEVRSVENCEDSNRFKSIRKALNFHGVDFCSSKVGSVKIKVTLNDAMTKYFRDNHPNIGSHWWNYLDKAEKWVSRATNDGSIGAGKGQRYKKKFCKMLDVEVTDKGETEEFEYQTGPEDGF